MIFQHQGQNTDHGYDPRICLNCGDGICEDPENRCSCPDDCDPNGCIGQGEPIDLNAGERCCAYLKHAWNYEWDGNGGCTEVSDVNVEGSTVQQVICVNCGNGICEEGESSCICPSDCGDLACADYGVVPIENSTEGAIYSFFKTPDTILGHR